MLIPFNELFKRFNIHAKGIIHCGASSGQERQRYADLGVENVIWIEAIPEVYSELVHNLTAFPNQIAINACLGEVDGRSVIFNVSDNEAQSSSFLELGTHKEAHPSVHYIRSFATQTKTLRTIINELGIDVSNGWVLVGDLQGSELFMLKGAGDLLYQFDAAYLEVNTKYVYEGCALKNEIEDYLARYGLIPAEEFIYHHWGWGDQFFIKDPSIHRY